MNTLLLFFAFPVATIILAIVIEKIIRNPILTAAVFFAIFLVIAFAFFDTTFLVYVIAYTILAYITAVIAEILFRKYKCFSMTENLGISNDNNNTDNNYNCNCNCQTETVTANITNNNTGRRSTWCCYKR